MKFCEFLPNKPQLENQYAFFNNIANTENSNYLYQNLKTIYRNEESKPIGYGKAIKYYFENVEIFINPADVFADITCLNNTPDGIIWENCEKFSLRDPKADLLEKERVIVAGADFGHTMPDWKIVMKYGIKGILEIAEENYKNHISSQEKDFYLSVKYAYEGILIFVKRLKETAEITNGCNAKFMAKNLNFLLNSPPQTLAQAMQLYFIFYTAQLLTQGNSLRSLGGLDEILFPYYVNDIKNNIFSQKEIRELIKYFLFRWNSRQICANIPFNLCTNTNEFTYIILEEYIKLNIPDPKIHIKCSKKTPKKVYNLIFESIKKGNNSFCFINEEILKKALVKIGIEEQDVEDYTLIGCYEPSASGKEIPCTLNGRINLPLVVESVINNGKNFIHDETIGENFGEIFENFDVFYAKIKEQLKIWCDITINQINSIEKEYPKIIHAPILSATYKECMSCGKDAYSGGAKYNNSSICVFGIATVADELIAIKKALFQDKIINMYDLKKILKNNWKGFEQLRKTIRDKYPKYGNNIEEVDFFAKDLQNFLSDCINGRSNGRGGVYRMGMFSIDWIIEYGKYIGAGPNGRFAGEPVSKNLSADVGMDKKGITGMINSVTKLDFTDVPNGAVLDINLHPTVLSGDNGIEIIYNLMRTYFGKGGYAFHINIIDPEILKKAQNEPEKYKNLQVRLCGWNVYFTDLDFEMQNNLIKSMESC